MKIIPCLLLVSAIALTSCGPPKAGKTKKDAAKKRAETGLREESSDVDFQAFLGRLRKAVQTRDLEALAAMMTTDFGYAIGATPAEDKKGDGVFEYWEEHGLWPEIDGILTESFVKKGDFLVAPPQFADENVNYDGYRAGIRRVNGSWKFVYFVNG